MIARKLVTSYEFGLLHASQLKVTSGMEKPLLSRRDSGSVEICYIPTLSRRDSGSVERDGHNVDIEGDKVAFFFYHRGHGEHGENG